MDAVGPPEIIHRAELGSLSDVHRLIMMQVTYCAIMVQF